MGMRNKNDSCNIDANEEDPVDKSTEDCCQQIDNNMMQKKIRKMFSNSVKYITNSLQEHKEQYMNNFKEAQKLAEDKQFIDKLIAFF